MHAVDQVQFLSRRKFFAFPSNLNLDIGSESNTMYFEKRAVLAENLLGRYLNDGYNRKTYSGIKIF
jgi:hypothetical protein